MAKQCWWEGCTVELQDSWVLSLHSGFVLWHDTANNDQWCHRHNDGKGPSGKKRKKGSQKVPGTELGDALVAALAEDATEDEKTEAAELVIRQAAHIASGSGSGQMSALDLVGSRLLPVLERRAKKPIQGQRCQTCGMVLGEQGPMVVDAETAILLADRDRLRVTHADLTGDDIVIADNSNGAG